MEGVPAVIGRRGRNATGSLARVHGRVAAGTLCVVALAEHEQGAAREQHRQSAAGKAEHGRAGGGQRLGTVAVPVVGVAGGLGVGAQLLAVDLGHVAGGVFRIGVFAAVGLVVERVAVGRRAFHERGSGDDGAVRVGIAFLDALERAGHADRFARLEHQGVPVGGIGERIHVHVRVADDGGVVEVQVACLEPCAVTGGRVGLGGVRDDERDADVVGVHLQRLLRVVAVRLLLAFLLEGRGIDLFEVDARGHVRGLGDDLVGFARLAVDGLGPRVGHLVGHGDALALEVEHPAGLVLVVGAHEVEVGLGRVGRDLAVLVGVHGEQVAAELRGVEAAARDRIIPAHAGQTQY